MISTTNDPHITNQSTLFNNSFPNNPHLSTPTVNIATHNVRSFNDPFKQKFLTNLYLCNHLDVIGIQETNFNSNRNISALRFSLPPSFVPFFEHKQNSQQVGFGVGLLIKKPLADHIYNHAGNLGRYIYVDLQFPARFKIRIINIYVSSSNVQLRTQTIKEVSEIIQQALTKNIHIILLGDFNAVPNRVINPSKSNEFFALLKTYNIFNSCDLVHDNADITHTTYRLSPTSTSSRIDHIFFSNALSNGILSSEVISVDPQYTDHSIVVTKITIPEITQRTISPKAIKKTVFLYDNINDQQWKTFSQKTDNLLESCHLKQMTLAHLSSVHNLNFYWNHLQQCIIKAAELTLPCRQSSDHIKDLRPSALKKDYRQLFDLQKLERISLQNIKTGRIKDTWINTYNKIRLFAPLFDIHFDLINT